MVYHGKVKNGVVVFAKGAGLPDGTEVQVEPFVRDEGIAVEGPTLAEQFADVIEITCRILPSDTWRQNTTTICTDAQAMTPNWWRRKIRYAPCL